MNKLLCKRLRDLREEKNWSQKTLAEKINMSQTGYNQYEIGKNDTPTEVLIKLSEIYNVSIDYLLGRINIKNYNIFLNEISEIENNKKCNECEDNTLVNCNPFEYEFICSKCGMKYYFKSNNYTRTTKKDL